VAEHARVGAIDDVSRVIDEFVVVGTIGDHKTVRELADSGLAGGGLGLLFLDHAKEAYVPDLQRILAGGWLHSGSVAVADNVGFPGAPDCRALMKDAEGTTWRTTEHDTHVEYQSLIKDLVLESTHLG
jgi:catechol O-methyltransferase